MLPVWLEPILRVLEITAGILLNVWIYKLARSLFGEQNRRLGVIIIRVISIYLIINGVSELFHM